MSSVPMTELSAPLVDIGDIAYSLKHGDGNKNPPSPAPTTEASGRAKLIANILVAVLFSMRARRVEREEAREEDCA